MEIRGGAVAPSKSANGAARQPGLFAGWTGLGKQAANAQLSGGVPSGDVTSQVTLAVSPGAGVARSGEPSTSTRAPRTRAFLMSEAGSKSGPHPAMARQLASASRRLALEVRIAFSLVRKDVVFFVLLVMVALVVLSVIALASSDFASKSQFGRRIVNGLLTMSLVVGITVSDLTDGTIIANLGYENVKHPHPVFHGDTLYVETTITARRESKSRPDCGIVTMTHVGRNQDGVTVVEVTRSALFLKREASG